ncbi:MAG: ABC transporter permease, partial [Methylococcales bacterium]|nr:ABC transporter permease [Methylococcales bacterium]
MVILWTDALIYFLVVTVIFLSFYVVRKPQFKRPLTKIFHNKSGMVSLIFLIFFMMIGLFDSVHFKSNETHAKPIISVLDYWMTPLRTQGEKTYSAPFSTHLYNKEMVVLDNGSKVWRYPRLKYAGVYLDKPEQQKITDIVLKSGQGFLKGVVFCAMMIFGLFLLNRYYGAMSALNDWKQSPMALKLISSVVIMMIIGSFILVELSSYYHIFGTDKVGEDVFYQAIKSIRTGLVIGSLTTLIMLPLAIVFGIMAGFFRGWVDDVIQYLYTTLNSIPSVLLIAASILMVQVYMANHAENFTSLIIRADMRLLFLCLILGVTSWTGLCRLLRAETLKLREMEYVQAAQALGVQRSKILWRHILPNVMHIVLISVALDFSALVLAEAVLSYINIGVDPTTYSWGNMINGARLEMARDPVVWWSLLAAFLFMFSLVLAANLFADTVRN